MDTEPVLNSLGNPTLLLRLKGVCVFVCVQLDGREDKMNRGAAAVYLHGISAFKHKNNTIKLPWWLYVTASEDGPLYPALCVARTSPSV